MKMKNYIITAIVLFNITSICYAEEKKDDGAEIIVKGNTDFAFDLYQQLKDEDGNLFFSPYSISTALAMTYAGAKNETAEQMAQTLYFSPDQQAFHPVFGKLVDGLNQQGKKGDYQLSVANALWGQKDYTFLDSFIQLNKDYYNAGLENVDFVNETEKTRQKINQWVEDKTNDKIKDLIPAGTLDAMTRLVLTNAIYFKGDWAIQFDPNKTEEADFFVSPDKTVTAPLMFQKEDFKYGQAETLQLLELPYKGDDLSMLVLLPKAKDGLAELESELTAENLAVWQKQMRKMKVMVHLPKFKMTSQFGLAETLKAMGMPDAFDANKADFSGMTGKKDLFISDVIHKAFVEVNEEGTEAAAATGVVMATRSAVRYPQFRADHPFVFVIKDNNTGSILFVGRVVDPAKE
jgi:serpin B